MNVMTAEITLEMEGCLPWKEGSPAPDVIVRSTEE